MQIEAEAANTRDDQLAFRYTISNGTHTPPPHNHSQSSLCEHHKKKLSDLFLIRHLTGNCGYENQIGIVSPY